MSWMDALKKQVLDSVGGHLSGLGAGGEADPAAPAVPAEQANGMLDGVVAMIREKGLGSLMGAFDQHGMKDVFASWVGKGSNLPISPDQLQKVLGPETLQALASKLGFSTAQASALLAQVLPQLVDRMTPEGQVDESLATPGGEPGPAAAESGHF